jgi:hypothetical protein
MYFVLISAPPQTIFIVLLILLALPFLLTVLVAVLASFTGNGKRTSQPAGETTSLVNKTLLQVRALFPFDFFPDALIVEENDVVIVKKIFFFSGWTESIPISDIKRTILSQGPFFSSLSIQQKSKEEVTVGYLRKTDAFAAKEMIDGLLLKHEGVVKIPKKIPLPVEKEILKQAGKNPSAQKKVLEKPL